MSKIIIAVLFVAIIFSGISAGNTIRNRLKNSNAKQQKMTVKVLGAKYIPNIPVSPTPGIPKILTIPTINVSANIEQVSVDSVGRMDVPKTDITVGWYSLGFRPGQKGSAVIDGHLDRVTGAPAIFWNLSKLKMSDKILVTDENKKIYTFVVTNKVNYPYNKFPLNDVFSSSNEAKLNLITCEGVWDSTTKNYSDRTVVYAKLAQ